MYYVLIKIMTLIILNYFQYHLPPSSFAVLSKYLNCVYISYNISVHSIHLYLFSEFFPAFLVFLSGIIFILPKEHPLVLYTLWWKTLARSSLSFCLKEPLKHLYFHRVFFSGCRSLDWQIFSFSTLKMLLYCFLASIISVTSAIQLVSVKRMYCLAAFCI